jgi:hypothetical protein
MVATRLALFVIVALFCVAVADGQTGAPPEPVGALEVSTDPNMCVEPTELRLWKLHIGPSGNISRTGRTIENVDCRWAIDGLTPGMYQADLIVPTGSGGSSEPFVVRAQDVTYVMIAPANVRVAGRVSIGGKPLANASIEFNTRDRQRGPFTVTTDASGQYSASLAGPGQYQILLTGKSAPTVFRNLDVSAGFNTFDWAITGVGSITVRVRNIRPELKTTVHIESGRASHNGDVAPGDEPVLAKEGLDFDNYSVSAMQGDTLVSTITNVVLDASSPAAAVDLELLENRSVLILTAPDGRPVWKARVRALSPAHFMMRVNSSIQPTEPGVYPLDGLRPGTYLLIRADGYVPACRTVPLNSTVSATLEVGRRVEVRLPRDLTPAAVRELAALSDIPGSDCPVPLAEFATNVKEPVGSGQPPLFEFLHFPSSFRFDLLRLAHPPRRIVVPDQGDVLVESP